MQKKNKSSHVIIILIFSLISVTGNRGAPEDTSQGVGPHPGMVQPEVWSGHQALPGTLGCRHSRPSPGHHQALPALIRCLGSQWWGCRVCLREAVFSVSVPEKTMFYVALKMCGTEHLRPSVEENISEHSWQKWVTYFILTILPGFLYGVEALKSVILTIAAAERKISAEKAVFLSRLELEFQVLVWLQTTFGGASTSYSTNFVHFGLYIVLFP